MENTKECLFQVKADRLLDGALRLFVQSDLIEDWTKKTALIEGATGPRYEFYAEVLGVTGYKHKRLETALASVATYSPGWGEWAKTYEFMAQILKAVGLKDGITVTIPRAQHDWTQAHVDQMLANLNGCVAQLYTRHLLPVAGNLTMTIVTETETPNKYGE